MATVYILYSKTIDKYYVGSCKNLQTRLIQHQKGLFEKAFTIRAKDWQVFYKVENLSYQTARKVENHIKKMKSRKYYHNLRKYDTIMEKLINKYSAGSSR